MASSRRIEFPTSDVVELERLSSACQPATFGKNKDHVLDETYRRARKMDVEDFAINMGFNFPDFLNHAVRRLLGAPHDDKSFRAELYKLNVYGLSPLSCIVTGTDELMNLRPWLLLQTT